MRLQFRLVMKPLTTLAGKTDTDTVLDGLMAPEVRNGLSDVRALGAIQLRTMLSHMLTHIVWMSDL